MTVVVGTAGHIDHGKTTLLRALTGIDADRLPEERRRGMTIDVGYAHLALPDGTELDFVDVPGHDRLIGNMLVGAGEIDAAMLVVAADDGPRAQTLEHLALLDALDIRHGLAVVTKADVAGADRTEDVMVATRQMLEGTSLAGSPVIAVSAVDGSGIEELRTALLDLRDRVAADDRGGQDAGSRLSIDRVFAVKGRGVVVTGTLRGGPLESGATVRLVPGDRSVRIREVQVHGTTVPRAEPGRAAVNLAGVDGDILHRGLVLTDDDAIVASDRLLVRLDGAGPRSDACPAPPRDRRRRGRRRTERSRRARPPRRGLGGDPASRCADRGRVGRPARPAADRWRVTDRRRTRRGCHAGARDLASSSDRGAGGRSSRVPSRRATTRRSRSPASISMASSSRAPSPRICSTRPRAPCWRLPTATVACP